MTHVYTFLGKMLQFSLLLWLENGIKNTRVPSTDGDNVAADSCQ